MATCKEVWFYVYALVSENTKILLFYEYFVYKDIFSYV